MHVLSKIFNIRKFHVKGIGGFQLSLDGVTMPCNLPTLTLGVEFNQSLEGVMLPANLQNLTYGKEFTGS